MIALLIAAAVAQPGRDPTLLHRGAGPIVAAKEQEQEASGYLTSAQDLRPDALTGRRRSDRGRVNDGAALRLVRTDIQEQDIRAPPREALGGRFDA